MKPDLLKLTYQLKRQHLREIKEMCSENLFRANRAVSVFFWVLVFVPIVAAIGAAGSNGPYATNAGLFLIGFLFAAFAFLTLQWRLGAIVAKNWLRLETRNGPIRASFSEQCARFETNNTVFEYTWPAIDSIRKTNSGTGVVCGAFAYVVPDSALPEDLPPDDFREILLGWKGEK